MNRSIRHTFLATTTACGLWFAPATAQTTATTDPVGAISFEIPSQSDSYFGLPLLQAKIAKAVVDSVSSQTITINTDLKDSELVDPASFVLFDSGALEGQWFSVIGNSGDSIEFDEDIETLGAQPDDIVSFYPFWTLNSFYEGVGNFPGSSSLRAPEASIITLDLSGTGINRGISAEYVYYDGTRGGEEGWFDINNPGAGNVGNVPLSPESYFIIRNQTESTVSLAINGEVPSNTIGLLVRSDANTQQDNYLVNPYPIPISLGESGLTDSVFVGSDSFRSPADRLLLFDPVGSGYNRGISGEYVYYSGSGGGTAGWYNINDLGAGLMDNFPIPAGGGFILRKAALSDEVKPWLPPTPY